MDKYNKPIKLAPRFWYGGVSKFNEPIVIGEIIINNKKFFNTVKSYLTTLIAINTINYYIQLLFCNEIDIGNNISLLLSNKTSSISLSVVGFNDKYVDLMNKVIIEMAWRV